MAIADSLTVIDDDLVRVTRWTFLGQGDETGDHVHEYEYVVVPVTGGTFTIIEADGSTRQLAQDAGVPYRGAAGTAHNVLSASTVAAVFVEIELKR